MRRILLSAVMMLSLFLGVYKSRLALLDDTSADPVAVYPLAVSMLPEADQLALSRGIPIGSGLDLARLLEDYLS